MMALLEIHDLRLYRGRNLVLEADALDIAPGETLAVIGPNGAGKSTLLLALAGLLPPQQGEIRFRGQVIDPKNNLSYRRQIGLVLQDPLLLDTSVAENVAAGLRFRGLPGTEIARRVNEWLERLGIAHLRNRPARQLSGGEAQRTSLARAFAVQPEVLLLDEPFSALDAPTRTRLLDDFQALLEITHPTTVFVTHDLDEALRLGDRAVVILSGQLRQVGTPEQVFAMPADPEVANFVGVETIISGQVTETCDGLAVVEAHGLHLEAVGDVQPGRTVLLCLRPEDVTLWTVTPATHPEEYKMSSARNRLSGRVTRLTPLGGLVRVAVDCGFPLVALITRTSALEMKLSEGQEVAATFKASAAHLIVR